jgi:hypothetical protein
MFLVDTLLSSTSERFQIYHLFGQNLQPIGSNIIVVVGERERFDGG